MYGRASVCQARPAASPGDTSPLGKRAISRMRHDGCGCLAAKVRRHAIFYDEMTPEEHRRRGDAPRVPPDRAQHRQQVGALRMLAETLIIIALVSIGIIVGGRAIINGL